jgi:hypothetical protein
MVIIAKRGWYIKGILLVIFMVLFFPQVSNSILVLGDTVGCAINFRTSTLFFTKNGVKVGDLKIDTHEDFFPVCGLYAKDSKVRFNFGMKPFKYQIEE